MKRWMTKLCALSVGAFAFLTLTAEVREDEFDCEQAVAHLVECCPAVEASNFYCQHDYGCDYSRDPDLTLDDSRCILALDCPGLVAAGVCARVAHVQPKQNGSDCSGGDCTPPGHTNVDSPVCR